jgi:hypothetical protein
MTENIAAGLLKLVLRLSGDVDDNGVSLFCGFVAAVGYGLWCWHQRDWTGLRNLLYAIGGVLGAIFLLLLLIPP